MHAFNGDPALKETILARVRGHLAAHEVVPLPAFWDGMRGSPAGCAVHDADPEVFATELGIPSSVLPVVESINRTAFILVPATRQPPDMNSEEPGLGHSFPAGWLDAITPGADVSQVPTAMIVWMLDGCEDGAIATVTDDRVRAALRGAADAHRAALRGDVPTRVEWAVIRKRAVELVNSLPAKSADAYAATAAESAAWPMTRSGSVALDVLTSFLDSVEVAAAAECGWTVELQQILDNYHGESIREAEVALKGLEGQAFDDVAVKVGTRINQAYRRKYPEFFQSYHAFQIANTKLRWKRVVSCQRALLALLGDAPVTAAIVA